METILGIYCSLNSDCCLTDESQGPEEEMEKCDNRMLDPPRILHGGKGSKVGIMRFLGLWL